MSDDGGKPTTVLDAAERPGLFEAFGVEIEMMIVDAETLDVKPVCDRLIESVAGEPVSELERGPVAWSNELTLHVLELKTNGPASTLAELSARFHEAVTSAQESLEALGALLMPGAMHPWMDPSAETRLWPHEYSAVYHTFDRIFGCAGHGWSNLQSTHLNLPFRGDEEFGRLHAAIRIALPLIPGLAAASPYWGGRWGGVLDGRMSVYRDNAKRVPSVSGRIVPEPVFSRSEYEGEILEPIYADLEPHDPEGILRYEWVNARGAIARFDRGAIEIRVIDAQECPSADLAVVAAVTHLVQALTEGPLSGRDPALDPSTETLALLLDEAIVHAERTPVQSPDVLRVLGLESPLSIGEFWRRFLDGHPLSDPRGEWTPPLETILTHGPLARRLLRASGPDPTASDLARMARGLCRCLSENAPFRADF